MMSSEGDFNKGLFEAILRGTVKQVDKDKFALTQMLHLVGRLDWQDKPEAPDGA
jgi:hypothetical protein